MSRITTKPKSTKPYLTINWDFNILMAQATINTFLAQSLSHKTKKTLIVL